MAVSSYVTERYVSQWATRSTPKHRKSTPVIQLPELPERLSLPEDLQLLDEYYLQLGRFKTAEFLNQHPRHQSRMGYKAAIESVTSLVAMLENSHAGFWAEAVVSYEVSGWFTLRHAEMVNTAVLPRTVEPKALHEIITMLVQADQLPLGSIIRATQLSEDTEFHVAVPDWGSVVFTQRYCGLESNGIAISAQYISNPRLRHYVETVMLANRLEGASDIPGKPMTDPGHPLDVTLPRHRGDQLKFCGDIELYDHGQGKQGLGQGNRILPVPVQNGWAQHMFSDPKMTGAKAYRILKGHLDASYLPAPAKMAR